MRVWLVGTIDGLQLRFRYTQCEASGEIHGVASTCDVFRQRYLWEKKGHMLTIKNLSKTYPNGVHALRGVHLQVSVGMFGLLGPNGAGKSSLMRTLAGLQEPDEGSVFFDGVDIVKEPHRIREQLGYLPQEFGVYPRISAWDLLNHLAVLKGITNRGERHDQVASLLQQTNLYEKRKKAVSSFSGGMRQRFGIAQALLGEPRLIIVDEPTAGLDPEERNRFHNLLAEIGEKIVIILSTHMVEDVSKLCNQMAVLMDGQVKIQGKPKDLIEQLAGQVWRGTVPKEKLAAFTERHAILSKQLVWGRPRVHLLAEHLDEPGFERVQPDLEDVYFSILKGREEVGTL